jgi:uncharacterized protein (DUF302 family)
LHITFVLLSFELAEKERVMRGMAILLIVGWFVGAANAGTATPVSGIITVKTQTPFLAYVGKLKSAIKANKLGIVAEACATCGAKAIGVTIPGNRVIMVFAPNFAVRMLKASEAAGIEAPLRLYVTEQTDGSAKLTYRLPSHTFALYAVPALDQMAGELDGIIANVVKQAGS